MRGVVGVREREIHFTLLVWRTNLRRDVGYIVAQSIPPINLSRNFQLAIKHYEARGQKYSLCYERSEILSWEMTVTKGIFFENGGSLILTYELFWG